jgi:uncharacterized protein (TIGR03435 family)
MNDYAARSCATRFATSLLLLILTAAAPAAQAFQAKPDVAPEFEVAMIKPRNPSAPPPGRLARFPVMTPPGRLIVANATLKDLIAGAYSLQAYQVTGGPAWIGSTRFDVEGKATGNTTREQRLLMLRSLLTERFKLALHRESKELAVYALEVGKKAPRLRPLKGGECWGGCPDAPSPLNHLRVSDIPALAAFVTQMGSDKPVVDGTGLKGNFAIELDMSKIQELAAQGDAGGNPTNTATFDALIDTLQDTLGLKLVSTKMQVDVFAIDHAEKVTEN